jgi:hypothetical protein
LNKKQQNEHTSSWFVLGQLMNTAGSSCYLAVMFFLQEAPLLVIFTTHRGGISGFFIQTQP